METGEVVQAFQAEGQYALLSADASRIAILRDKVAIIEVASGDIVVVGEGVRSALGVTDQPGRRLEDAWNIELIETPEGDGFAFALRAAPELDSLWQRYTWDGELLAEGIGAKVYISPDGSLVAVAERVPGDEPTATWHVLNVLSTTDSTPVFRVVGVDEKYGVDRNRWLADGSGIVVRWPSGLMTIAMRSTTFRDLIGSPSPTDVNVFDIGGGIADEEGDPIFQLSFPGGVRDFVDGWGDTGDEVRLLIPFGGHDCCGGSATIVEPYIESAPYVGPVQLQLSETAVAFGLLSLYDEPGGDIAVGQVGAPYRVTVLEVAVRCTGESFRDPQECPPTDSDAPANFIALVQGIEVEEDAPLTSYWARVTTLGGQEGWLLMQANQLGL
jgi:hypothetical protein